MLKLTESELTTPSGVCITIFPKMDDTSPFYSRNASDISIDRVLSETVKGGFTSVSAADFTRVPGTLDSRLHNLLLSGSPTAPSGEFFAVRNLYIGDACVFPSTPAVHPLVTIMAMASLTAESIKAAFRSRRD